MTKYEFTLILKGTSELTEEMADCGLRGRL